ncbi:MAG: hypothetical protein M3Y57_01830 [Acidobacteriota bacterium]|nr:hypothetical protein [Acidobacteriota bacterium]
MAFCYPVCALYVMVAFGNSSTFRDQAFSIQRQFSPSGLPGQVDFDSRGQNPGANLWNVRFGPTRSAGINASGRDLTDSDATWSFAVSKQTEKRVIL